MSALWPGQPVVSPLWAPPKKTTVTVSSWPADAGHALSVSSAAGRIGIERARASATRGAGCGLEVVVPQTGQQCLDVDHVLAHPGTYIVGLCCRQHEPLATIGLRVREGHCEQGNWQPPVKAMATNMLAGIG